jgi:serine/threonine protein kinase
MNPTPGTVIQGYRLVRPIGFGGFGEVWLVRAEATGASKALKWIRGGSSRHLDQELGALRRYSQEVGNARSTHLVPIEHVSLIEDSMILVMPLADGTGEDPADPSWTPVTLRALMDRHGRSGNWFTLDEIKQMMGGVLTGAAWLSEKGLQHRDIKPENILFLGGEPTLADFGLVAEDQTLVSMRGTPHHAAPSWYLESGGNADQWGCAIILYQLLTGNAPDKIAKPKYLRPAPGMGELTGLDLVDWKRLHHLVLRSTSEDPGERFQGLEAFRKALESSPVAYPPKPRRKLLALAAGAFLLIPVAAIFMIGKKPSIPSREQELQKPQARLPIGSATPRPAWMDRPQHIYSQEEVERINGMVLSGDKEGMKKLIEANEARYRELVKQLPTGSGLSWIMEKMRFPEKAREIPGNERNTSRDTNECRPTHLSPPDPSLPSGSSPPHATVPVKQKLLSSVLMASALTAHAALDPSPELGKVAEQVMLEASERLHPQQILIALSEVSTGKILTAAFQGSGKDPHDLSSLVYEPASSIKPFVVATALESGAVQEGTRIDVKEAEFAGHPIVDPLAADQLTPPEIVARRNNVGVVRIAERLSDKQLYDGLKAFGFGADPGHLPSPAEWIGETKVRLAIGQSMAVTPMQMLWAYNVLAYDGLKPGEKDRILSSEVSKIITRALTGILQWVPGLSIAGTSSTSRAIKGAEYEDGRFVTQTIGFFPADHPRYIAQVVVDGAKVPNDQNLGALVSEPVFREFVEKSSPILGLKK